MAADAAFCSKCGKQQGVQAPQPVATKNQHKQASALQWILGIAGICVILSFGTCVYVCGSVGTKMNERKTAKEGGAKSVSPAQKRIDAARYVGEHMSQPGLRVEAIGDGATTLRYAWPDCSGAFLDELVDAEMRETMTALGFNRVECHDGSTVVGLLDL